MKGILMMKFSAFRMDFSHRWELILVLMGLCCYSVSSDCIATGQGSSTFNCIDSTSCLSNWTSLKISQSLMPVGFFHSCSQVNNIFFQSVPLNELNEMTLKGLSGLQKLTFYDVPLLKFAPSVFKFTPKLTKLNAVQVKTVELRKETFQNCHKLETVAFSKSSLVKLDPLLFSGCGISLKSLTLQGKLNMIPDTTFNKLTSLMYLDLSTNVLEKLTANMFSDLTNLQSLLLKDNQIRSIDTNALRSLTALKKLVLTNNLLTILHDDTFQGLSALQYLDLSNNRITKFNIIMLKQLPFLKRLSLRNNRILTLDLNSSKWNPIVRLSIRVSKNRFLCRPYFSNPKIRLIGLSDKMDVCEFPEAEELISSKVPKHQRLSIPVESKKKSGTKDSTKQIVVQSPTWIFIWAITMTVGFAICFCTLIFIFLNRSRDRRMRQNRDSSGQELPLNNQNAAVL